MKQAKIQIKKKTRNKYIAFDAYHIAKHVNLFFKDRFTYPTQYKMWCDFEADSFTELAATISLTDPFWVELEEMYEEFALVEKYLQNKYTKSLGFIKNQLIADLESWTSSSSVNIDHDGAHLFLWADTSIESFEEDTKILMERLVELIGKSKIS